MLSIVAATMPVRKTVYGGRRRQKVVKPVVVSDEESAEDESVTRCVCGESRTFHNYIQHYWYWSKIIDSAGLMVCCDECEVWQHCECMGLDEEEIPDQYFCELCKPFDHVEVKGYDK